MSIGKNIAKYRKAKGLTQEELGAKLGVTNQSVSKWESEVSMPDVMLLPEIANALNITLDDLYGIAKEVEKISCSADDFPAFCHKKLIELFYYNTKMRFTHVGSSDKEQLEFQIKKLMDGCRMGCLSNTQRAIVTTEDFSFVDNTSKAANSENIINSTVGNILSCFSVESFQKVFSYQYKIAFEHSKTINWEFTFDEIMNECNLSREETQTALYLLKATNINRIDIDKKAGTEKYIFLISNALYAHAIYRLAELLCEDACWAIVRDTSMISDYAFE
jgi:transcriptional regulator with XRE-family HTH domain